MELIRGTNIKIDIDVDVAQRTQTEWVSACNFISQIAFSNGCISNAVKLYKLVYEAVRTRFKLSSQITQSAINHVASKYASLRTQKKQPKTPVRFKETSAVVLQGGSRGRDFSFVSCGMSVWTVDGRIKPIPFHGEEKLQEYLTNWQPGDARLYIRKTKVYMSVSFKRLVPSVSKPNDSVIGVDRGINYIAVATDGKKAQFFGGGPIKHVRNQYSQTRAKLQQKLADAKKARRNTRSLRRLLKRLSGREARVQKFVNHFVSRCIIEFAKKTGNPTIAIEKLDGIRNGRRLRKTQRTDLNRWAFYQLEQFLRYKAQDYGFEVIEINPKGTSKGCSRCGYANSNNRKGHDFTCGACGYKLHADLNAARNIRLRGILSRQALAENGAPSVAQTHG